MFHRILLSLICSTVLLAAGCFGKKKSKSPAPIAIVEQQEDKLEVEYPSYKELEQDLEEYLPQYSIVRDNSIEAAERKIYFQFNGTKLSESAKLKLKRVASVLKSNKSLDHNIIEGHCDKLGTTDYNLALGSRRAKVVRDYLVSLGISAKRLEIRSYGKEKLEMPGDSDEDHAANRRVFVVLGKSSRNKK